MKYRSIVGLLFALLAPCVHAQSTAKELFIGVDGGTTQLASKESSIDSAKPAKAVRPKVLGLQTTIYQLFDDGGVKSVSPSTVFAGGSRIRMAFNSNRHGFLYVVNLGTSGRVTTIFPAKATDNNHIQPGRLYQVPQQTGKSIRFDSTPGDEVILVVLAESRLTEFEYGGQTIALRTSLADSDQPAQAARPQTIAMASLDVASTSKDLFVEDDGVFQTVVFNPASEASNKKKPLVTRLNLKHR